jgi:hypothetical protein
MGYKLILITVQKAPRSRRFFPTKLLSELVDFKSLKKILEAQCYNLLLFEKEEGKA